MTLRKLYNYVMKSISTRPNNLPENCIMPNSVRNMNDIGASLLDHNRSSLPSMEKARKKKLSDHGGGYIPTIRNEEIPISSESSQTGHESVESIWESISSSESADEQRHNNDPHKTGASKSLMKGTISNEVDPPPLRHASPSITCTETDVVAINPLYLSSAATHMAPEVSNTKKVSFRVPDLQGTPRDPRRDPNGPAAPTATTYRQRLGGYLHPRDMRRLVTPFSSTNEPQLIVRRHVMLLNFDPLRAVVLRDRLLVLIPDGADDLIMALERRVRGGVAEMENRIFGDDELADLDELIISGEPSQGGSSRQASRFSSVEHRFIQQPSTGMSTGSSHSKQNDDDDQDTDASDTGDSNDMGINDTDEWAEMGTMNWIDMPFELQAVDAVLSTVMSMLADDGDTLRNKVQVAMAKFRGDTAHNSNPSELAQDKLRILKDHVKHMEARVQGFVRAMNLVLNDDADMALMNLSRLVTHPERFIQPVPDEILAQESDEPELILEAYLQHALSTVNAMDFVKSAITNTEELVALQLDSLRNKLLYINTLVSLLTLSISCASLVGSFMGMNVPNHLEDDPNAFRQIVFGTMFGALGLALLFLILFQMTGALPSGWKSPISF
eukprot:scaffold272907_cov60-Attheya_sp.AAC.2